MFSVVSRSVSRRVLVQSTRCMAQKPPKSAGSVSSSPPPPPPAQNSDPKESEQIEQPVLTRSSVPSLDFSPPDPAEQRTGASSRDNLSSADRQRRAFARVAFGLFTLGFGLHVAYMGREWEQEELQEKKLVCSLMLYVSNALLNHSQTLENAPAGRWERTKNRYSGMFSVCSIFFVVH